MTETGNRMNRPQAPADEPVLCSWDALGEPQCENRVDYNDVSDLCQAHNMQAMEENEADMAVKRSKEWT